MELEKFNQIKKELEKIYIQRNTFAKTGRLKCDPKLRYTVIIDERHKHFTVSDLRKNTFSVTFPRQIHFLLEHTGGHTSPKLRLEHLITASSKFTPISPLIQRIPYYLFIPARLSQDCFDGLFSRLGATFNPIPHNSQRSKHTCLLYTSPSPRDS